MQFLLPFKTFKFDMYTYELLQDHLKFVDVILFNYRFMYLVTSHFLFNNC